MLLFKVTFQLNLVDCVLFEKLLSRQIIGVELLIFLLKAMVSGMDPILNFSVLALQLRDHFIFPMQALDLIVLLLHKDAVFFFNNHQLNF